MSSPPIGPEAERKALLLLPKAELHLHLEGTVRPMLLIELARGHNEALDYENVAKRYNTGTFREFLELFKWVTSCLRAPGDYARVAESLVQDLRGQNVRYAEVTLSVGVMLLRKQDVEANFAAILRAVERAKRSSEIRIHWIFDAVRQFGPDAAMEVAKLAVRMKAEGVVAFGLGGDEESLPAAGFRRVYDYVAGEGLHRVVHAGEMGGPKSALEAIEILRAERIGHGIAVISDEALMDLLIERNIPLEICPVSNLRTGALAKLLGAKQARIEDHPLSKFIARGVPVTLGTDDPAMFGTSLEHTYRLARQGMGLSLEQILQVAEAGFRYAFLLDQEKEVLSNLFRSEGSNLGLL